MSTSTLDTVLCALVDALTAVPALSGVGIYSAPIGDDGPLEIIEFAAEVESSQEPHSMGGNREVTDSVTGAVTLVKPGAGETAIRAARLRTFAIFAALETYLNDNPTIDGSCFDSDMSRSKMRQDYVPEGRVCQIEFTIDVVSLINP